MPPLKATDSRLIPFPAEAIWPILADMQRYPQWWPKILFPRVTPAQEGLIGTELHLRPMGGPPITCVVRATSVTECIELEYIGNFITGHAHWRLDPRDQGTQVSYVLDVHVHGLLGALISRFINLQPIHSFSMRNILKELEQQVKQHSAQTF
ncbi:SRPBCC family protein [Desulfobulbus rhabdoformis]|uniref:type II toxin-antitoxin system RatA family toxin n=1 Tax=Desulfobulbus rhabdoformis TaxID=34032 RepID=UPI001964E3C4|nr:SRPBCC family protein [Desulfobulbus rhabdoformis]MBM9615568.1 SRPBCC family protein [Desulfobulbus rhabdoformis]